jgi:acetyl-CoA carboxylase carboxyl transferase subunit alpha
MARIKVPIVVVVLGEGGSGGALAIGIGDRVLMMENAVYSVISPEGCAAILWKDAAMASEAATGLRLTADDLKEFSIVDEIIAEPNPWNMPANGNGAETDAFESIGHTLRTALVREIKALSAMPVDELLSGRYDKFRKMGAWNT